MSNPILDIPASLYYRKFQSGTLTGTSANITFSGLDGNADGAYLIEISGAMTGAATEGMFMACNGTANTVYALTTLGNSNTLILVNNNRAFATRIEMPFAATGQERGSLMQGSCTVSAGVGLTSQGSAMYENTATNITSIALTWQSGGVFAVGTKYSISRRQASA